MRYWLNTVSKDHVLRGQAGGFVQANHGKQAPLGRLQAGDLMVFYSPKEIYGEAAPCQKFTALAEIGAGESYQVGVPEPFQPLTFQPFRKNARYLPVSEAPIQPLLDELSFIPDRAHWGLPFRRGLFEISREDFAVIAAALGVTGAV